MAGRTLRPEPLTAEAFAPFGVVVDVASIEPESINEGHSQKFGDVLPLDCNREGGRVAVHFYRSRARTLPLEVRGLERHPLGSQAFWPLSGRPYLVVVAAPGPEPDASEVRAFLAGGHQAIQFHTGTWHHFQISLEADSDYLVIDRVGPGNNLDLMELDPPLLIPA